MSTDGIQITHEGNKVNIVMDMSMFDLFELCACRYNYRHNKNYAPPMNMKAQALDLGGLAHEGFESYFNSLKQGIHYNDRMQKSLMKMKQVASDPELCNLSFEDVDLLIRAFEECCDYWRFEDEQLEILEVERAFAYTLYEDDEIRIIITGKIDLLVNYTPIGGRGQSYTNLPIDHKTYSKDFEVPRLSNQFQNYAVATGSNYLVVNRVGLHNPDAKKPKPASEKFQRVPLSYDPLILSQWRDNVIAVIIDEYLTCVSTGRWNMNFTSCFKFNRKCEYYEVCETSGVEEKERKLLEGFAIVSPWDVTASFNKNKKT